MALRTITPTLKIIQGYSSIFNSNGKMTIFQQDVKLLEGNLIQVNRFQRGTR